MSKQGEPYVFVVVSSDQSSNEDASEDGEESLLYEYHQVDENEYDSQYGSETPDATSPRKHSIGKRSAVMLREKNSMVAKQPKSCCKEC